MPKNFAVIATVLVLSAFIFPSYAHALSCPASVSKPESFEQVVCLALEYLKPLFVILVSGSLLVFVWGVAKFIWASGDEKKIAEGKTLMFWGIIALFVMTSLWAIIALLQGDLFGGSTVGIPQL